MEKEKLRELLLKYISGDITKSESDELLDYVIVNGDSPDLQFLMSEMLDSTVVDASVQLDADSLYQRIINDYEGIRIRSSPRPVKWWWYGAAAVVIFAIGIWMTVGDAVFNDRVTDAPVMRTVTTAPTDRPQLRLASGRTINLDSVMDGVLAIEGGIKISLHDNALYYSDTSEVIGDQPLINTVATPKGCQYQVVLPDGSKLWLNAASTVSYPIRFDSKKREITVSGEAYLEVEHAAEWPFVVYTKMQQIEVVGTKFNVSAYPDDLTTKTTLVDGRVKVSFGGKDIASAPNSVALSPGQQLVSTAGQKGGRISRVDPDETVSWKDNLFVFSDEEISDVMKKVSRWYDVEIEYLDGMAGKRIGGSIPRLTNVAELMDALKDTGLLQYKMEGGTIVVMR